ncbi:MULTISPECIES: hypothetical protein [Methylobacterium]|uniref:Uncharacterized protein n=1 Tax=Methylobacterium brachiatum TaxID=269660 RepID=A0ABV1QWQ7_9HYPH|nr:hypothetical protein [Methylobacterium sp. GXF4]
MARLLFKRFAARETPTVGPEAVRHAVLAEESRKVLGVPRA